MTLVVIFATCLLFTAGCDSDKKEKSQAPSPPVVAKPSLALLQEPLEVDLNELPTEALFSWIATQDSHPVLLLYSRDPFLQPVPDKAMRDAMQLLTKGEKTDFAFGTVNPVILPKMALSVALKGGFFSKVIWVIPTMAEKDELSTEVFREQLVQLGAVTEEESRSFTLNDGVFSGQVRNVPFEAVHPATKLDLSGPVVMHFDLSYLTPYYEGEVKTPIYPLTYNILRDIRDQNLTALTVSFSYSQLSGDIPLGSRFIGPVFAEIFRSPDLLNKPLPPQWERHRKALYLPNFFRQREARELYLDMETDAPDDPAVKYGLYTISRELKKGIDALAYLAESARLDRVYALEYLNLAQVAKKKGLPEKSIEMLQLAANHFPNNPFFRLQLAEAMINQGKRQEARPILQELKGLEWSQTYHAQMDAYLNDLLERVKL